MTRTVSAGGARSRCLALAALLLACGQATAGSSSLDALLDQLSGGFSVAVTGQSLSSKGKSTAFGPLDLAFRTGDGVQIEGPVRVSATVSPMVHAIVDPDQLFLSTQPRLAAVWVDLTAPDVPADVKDAVRILGMKKPASAAAARLRREARVLESDRTLVFKGKRGDVWTLELDHRKLPRTLVATMPSSDRVDLAFEDWRPGKPAGFTLPLQRAEYRPTTWQGLLRLPRDLKASVDQVKQSVNQLRDAVQEGLRSLFR
ncbi:MAG: hypothetical protein HY814_04680 [Candidatus Riflebacteria bacterium]|nr:hypothetical protein [Candidatus Riflebacteria bacterium]